MRSKDYSSSNVVFISNLIDYSHFIVIFALLLSTISDACFLVNDSHVLCFISFAGSVNFVVFLSSTI